MKTRFFISLSVLIACSANLAHAVNITNNIQGVGPDNNKINPYFCIQNANGEVTAALAPGQQIDGNTASGNPYYVGGSLRFGGCSINDTYLGYVGFNISTGNKSFSSYSPPPGVHIQYANPSVDQAGNIGGSIQYTPISTNNNFLHNAPSKNAYWNFVGINLSGLEFGKMVSPSSIPNLSEDDATTGNSDLADTQKFIQAGMNTVRVPVSWDYLQLNGAGVGDIDSGYYNSYVQPLLETLTAAKVHVILDLHDYMRYSQFGKEYSGCGPDSTVCPQGTLITDSKIYEDIWSKLYQKVANNPHIDMNYIMLDLNNEPVNVPNDDIFTIQADLIKMLRAQGFKGYILVEGNNWSGLHSWTTASWKSTDGKTTYTNATLFTKANFNQHGITDLSKILINVHQYLDSNYSGTHDSCLTDLSTTGPEGFNLNAFADYLKANQLKAIVTEFGGGKDSSTCAPAINSFLNYLKTNAANGKDYGFVGWTIWSTGHGWGTGYNLRVTPESYQMDALRPFLQAAN